MDNTIWQLWAFKFIMGNGTVTAFLLMLIFLLLKCLLISAYFSFLYGGIWCLKRYFREKMGAQANYYCWYMLLASILLANLEFNDYFKVLLYEALFAVEADHAHWLFLARCLLLGAWLLVAVRKLAAYIMLNRKIQKSFKYMRHCDYGEQLAIQAAKIFGLREKISVLTTDFIVSPLSYGIFQKVILLPENFKDKYSAQELYLLILHEAAHLKNGDTIKLRLITIIECFLWFNPVMRLFAKQFQKDTEILCDNRVVGINGAERDTYAGLILKECASRKTFPGVAFSDSYNTIANRLDALYRHKPEKHGRTVFAVVITVVLLIGCASYQPRTADYFIINNDYKSKFEVVLTSADFMSYEILDPVICNGIYTIEDDIIRIDKMALKELVGKFPGKGYQRVHLSTDNFSMKISEFTLSGSGGYNFEFDELAVTSEDNRYLSEQLEKRPLAEYLFLFVTSKL